MDEEQQEESKEEPEENEAEKRERLQREEREDIMARLEEEERAQYVFKKTQTRE
ncbi:hypothetical protein I307_01720 [Cryptococcus deuterogattii 99/473]|uniref:Uncharacterized protein n=1 Tax=Cryptococcus deuterogattii Ram5 TaxID=1296110 RepID=A0A0D0V218_9TREE|nr:hypothetical protein I309_04301 [Cryptococcus deuterogattii LA55]KIR36602.1 hypothetical protein I352_01560 [Cryptococcus deuterogattii MMRL2647]KIR39005.1 hypothetical protein I313_05154 [Cryptococcus deuterogattii Ram5]KIR76031.1 hypothetical protein I310_00738 [Cryptococcus deuterogattii CA1014]KIR95975.1 hypothetical protein I304_00740 [Cryptococcus deuterogattii CBS 10090]KIS02471.1 hypothetical protein L804_00741 [Cryptococcus deuterogattii 2001/935-1]KIY58918.1 hypothetical protein 